MRLLADKVKTAESADLANPRHCDHLLLAITDYWRSLGHDN
ncbi:MAG: hypothetical protein ACRDDA_03625 [Aeromonas sp.]